MKIAILSRNSKLYSTRRLVEACQARGHEAQVIDTLRCYMNITPGSPEIHSKGENLVDYGAVIPRIGASITFYGTAVLRQFEMMNRSPSPGRGINCARCSFCLAKVSVCR